MLLLVGIDRLEERYIALFQAFVKRRTVFKVGNEGDDHGKEYGIRFRRSVTQFEREIQECLVLHDTLSYHFLQKQLIHAV